MNSALNSAVNLLCIFRVKLRCCSKTGTVIYLLVKSTPAVVCEFGLWWISVLVEVYITPFVVTLWGFLGSKRCASVHSSVAVSCFGFGL